MEEFESETGFNAKVHHFNIFVIPERNAEYSDKLTKTPRKEKFLYTTLNINFYIIYLIMLDIVHIN